MLRWPGVSYVNDDQLEALKEQVRLLQVTHYPHSLFTHSPLTACSSRTTTAIYNKSAHGACLIPYAAALRLWLVSQAGE